MTTKSKSEVQAEVQITPVAELEVPTAEATPVLPSVIPAPTEKQVAPVEVAVTPDLPSFSNSQSFDHAQRVAKMLATSDLIPQHYRGNIQNCMIALEMANRIGASPLQVMQNLYIVQGKPSWSSSFIIAAINACKKFSPLRFEVSGEGEDFGCSAWAYDLATGDRLEGPKITMRMASSEGWLNKPGSKWKTMPDLMMRYRAAAFFGRLYAPEILMGMHTAEENEDIAGPAPEDKKAALANRLNQINLK